jgi:hypothetical protein
MASVGRRNLEIYHSWEDRTTGDIVSLIADDPGPHRDRARRIIEVFHAG